MNTATPTIIIRPPLPPPLPPSPPFPAPSGTVDLNALEFILALIAIITIPVLIYAFFCAIKCPPNPFERRHHRSSDEHSVDGIENMNETTAVSDVKYQKETHVKDVGTECPVCLSVFDDGEEVRQLSVCKHSFHASCIDMWLNSHSNCPICRASIAVKRPSDTASARDDDLRQGLPDAATLV